MTGEPTGILVVDKPAGCTSHDVVGRVRRILHTRKVGHAGTLDPMATGVLVVAVGRATKLLTHLILTEKSYAATIRLGAATLTDDVEGEVLSTADPAVLAAATDEAIRAGITALTGDILQRPTSVSAIKVDGRRAYDLVRAGEQVDLPARPVTVSRFEVTSVVRRSAAAIDLDVVVDCSSGTYIRALARDLGESLGVGGHLTALRRTAVGPFVETDAVDVYDGRPPAPRGERNPDPTPELEQRVSQVLLPMAAVARRVFPVRIADGSEVVEIGYGRPLAATGAAGLHALLDPSGEQLLALLTDKGGQARPELVLAAR